MKTPYDLHVIVEHLRSLGARPPTPESRREVEDFVACKPHASPMDHSFHHLMRVFGREDGTWLDDETAKRAMHGLRMFPEDEDFSTVFQSYHARTDPDWVRTQVAAWDDRISGLSRREALKHLS